MTNCIYTIHVDKKQFLRELTNFAYSFTNKYNLTQMLNKLKTNINDLQKVNLIIDNWKLVDINWRKDRYKFENEFKKLNNKWYFFIKSDTYGFNKHLAKNNSNNIKQVNVWNWILILNNGDYAYLDASKIKLIYYWDGVGEPQTPTINSNNGEITDWSVENQNKVKDFLNKYLDVIIQENIRVQQGGNPDYESSIVGTQQIIFDFEIVDESERYTAMYFIKKSIYRMILTIDKNNNIIAGSLELTHTKTVSNYAFHPYK